MTLYEMTAVATQLYDLFTEGEIPEEAVNDTLEGIGIADKVEDYCKVINQLNADVMTIDAEIDRLNAKKQRAKKGVDRMKTALLGFMTATDTTKTSAGTFNLSIRKSKAVVISDLEKVPEKYITVKTTTAPDKKAIKSAIESGEQVEGAAIQINSNLMIK